MSINPSRRHAPRPTNTTGLGTGTTRQADLILRHRGRVKQSDDNWAGNMLPLSRLWRPETFHGFGHRRRLFEGWYFKSISAGAESVYSVIPGVSVGGGQSHAFIQVLNGLTRQSWYHEFSVKEFFAEDGRFDVSIGPNRFSNRGITLDIADSLQSISGELRFTGIHRWPVTILSPGFMGPYAFAPFLECYHDVLSLNHRIDGRLVVDGLVNDFAGGKGYIEKDWGHSMPAAWVWMQTNHFDEPDASLSVSVANVPWLGSSFSGFGIALWLRGHLYRFATYTGARLQCLAVGDSAIAITVADRRTTLEITARRAAGAILASPKDGAMVGRIQETITAEATVRLTDKTTGAVFADSGRHAALEIVGDPSVLGASDEFGR